MKLLSSIFILIISGATALCQISKIDNLKKVLTLLESDKVKIDEKIKKVIDYYFEFHRILECKMLEKEK